MSRSRVIASVLVVTVFAAAGLAYFIRGGSASSSNPQQAAASNTSHSTGAPALAGNNESPSSTPSPDSAMQNGRPATSSTSAGRIASASTSSPDASGSSTESSDQTEHKESNEVYGYGRTPAVAPDANPNVKSVVEAIQTKSHPERLSALIAPAKFDKAAYEADPAAYLAVSEPGRVYQTAQPGRGVPVLRPASSQFVAMTQGETIELAVKGVPAVGNNAGNDASGATSGGGASGGPVTFTSADLGRFENELTSITVAADARGIAKVHFTAPPGTINTVRILRGSPLATGQVEFVVQVEPAPGTPGSAGAVSGATEEVTSEANPQG